MELTCPCGNGYLIRKVTTKGPNMTRPYYKCPGSDKENNISDCKFYSFEDELKHCPCGRGFCRTIFRRNKKYWCCCVMGDGDCRFSEIITSTWQPPSSSTPPAQSLSPSSRSSSTPPAQSLSPSSRSSQPPSSSQGARSNVMTKHELLVRSLEVSQSSNVAYLELIKKFADSGLED